MSRFIKNAKEIFHNGSKAKLKSIIICGTAVIIIGIILVVGGMRKTVTINIDGEEQTFITYKGTVKEVLALSNISISDKDKLQPSLDSKLDKNELIEIKRAVPVTINANGKEFEIQSADNTIEEMLDNIKDELSAEGIEFNKDVDEVIPSLDSQLESGLDIKLVKIDKKEVVEKEAVQYETVVEKSSDFDINYEKTKTEGVNGEKEVVYEVVYRDGVEDTRSVKSSKVITQPQNKVVVKGTSDLAANRGSNPAGKTVLKCSATAYSGGWGTSSGRKPCRVEGGLSTIAVDPTFIPMGSKVYVEGYGYAVAADTGTAIKGNKIDVYFNSYKESCDWGLKQVNVTIIAYPGEW